MIQASTLNPALSPAFGRARKLSRAMAVIFAIGFCLTLLGALLSLAVPLEPILDPRGHAVVAGFNAFRVTLDGLSVVQCVWVMLALELAILPVVFLMYHAGLLFWHFARGEVFVVAAIAHIRAAGLWLIASFFGAIAGPILLVVSGIMHTATHITSSAGLWPLVIGIVTFIAAYVMEEARRIAADNAEIV
jgi:hypothetical protein